MSEEQQRPRVAVVFGGRSSEHAISCVSAGSVLAAIDRSAWDIVPVGITTEGRWVLVPDEPAKLAITGGVLPAVDDVGASVVLAPDPTRRELQLVEPGAEPRSLGVVDVVFPLLHGPYGEDGTVQGLLELAGVPYVGSGVSASATAMDKSVMKPLLRAAGLPVGPYVTITPTAWASDPQGCLDRVVAELTFPVFVKPARAGSSVGISRVSDTADLRAAVDAAREHDPRVVVEQAVPGREIECGVVLGAGESLPRASVPAEVRVRAGHDFYDFEAKYLDGAEFDVPADLTPALVAEVQRLSVEAFTAMGCEGLARVDFFLGADGTFVVNEVNTMPGFTSTSMFPRMWAASGVEYPELVDTLLREALSRPAGLR
jgi:D-alanine-D-alanine ligase